MEAIITIVECLITPLIAPVKRHLGFLIFSRKNVEDMNDKVNDLKATAEGIRRKEASHKENSQFVPDGVPGWLTKYENIIQEVERIPTGGDGCFNIIKNKYKAGKKSSLIIKRIDDLDKQESNIKWTSEQIPLHIVTRSSVPSTSAAAHDDGDGTQDVFTSRKLIYEGVLKELDPSNKTQKMAICGMGGVGKTTMMEELKKAVERKQWFDSVVSVVIGNKTDTTAFQQAVADFTGLPVSATAVGALEERLKKKISEMSQNGTKKILIILDDVWEVVDLKVIGLPSPLPSGFKLLLTSRYEKVCIHMDVATSMIFRMVVLEEEEAKDLFWKIASVSSDVNDAEFNKLGEEIIKKCGGLPMAIKTIALSLKGAIKDAWKHARSRLYSHDLKDLNDILNGIFEISYDKTIFLLCGLFPDDFDIPLEELMLYGWGLKLFDSRYCLIGAREQTNVSVNNLIRANLLTESYDLGCVKMHDLARAFVLSDVSKFKQASIVNHRDKLEWPKEDKRASCKRMLLNCAGMSEIPHDFCYPNLELLVLMGDKKEILKFSEEFHTSIGKLEVMAYHRMQLSLSSVSLQCSTSVRTLCLRSCSLPVDISFLGDLSNLEVLSFAYCGVRKLPSTIGKLTKLKLLDLTGCIDLRIDDGVFQKLDELEELYLRSSQGKAIRFTEDNCHGLELLSEKLFALDVEFVENILEPKNVSFTKLERFQISMGCPLEKKWEFKDDFYSYKNTLKLATNKRELLECKVDELFEKTEELELSVKDLNHLEQILPPLPHHSFSKLEVLSVSNCADLTFLFTIPVANGMKKLERLKVSSCPVLKSLIGDKNSGVREISFPNLKRLTLHNLPDLVSLCETSIDVMELPQLMWLELFGLPNITSIFPWNNNNDISSTQLFLSKKVMIPKLKTLQIIRMEKLKEIWSYSSDREEVVEDCGFRKISFPKLKNLYLENLPDLVSLCETSIDVMELPQLKWLELQYLPNITSIFPWNNNNDISSTQLFLSKKVMIPKLEKLGIGRMEKLKEIWSCSSSERDEEVNYDNSMLRQIIMIECDSVENVFPSNPMRLLSHLEDLIVTNCGSIEVLFNIDMGKTQQLSSKSSLRSIYVYELNMLREVWRIKDNCNSPHHHLLISGFQAVESITIWNCKKFRNVFTPTTAARFDMGALTEIRIEDCREGSERNNGAELVENINSQEQEINNIVSEEVMIPSKVGDINTNSTTTHVAIFPFHQLTHTFHHLRKIYFVIFKGVEVVFEIENETESSPSVNNRGELQVTTTTQQPFLLLPCLEELQLGGMDDLTHVWKCNWNEFSTLHMKHQPQSSSSSFQNLTTIILFDCKSIKYLFSPLMAKLLSNLKKICISICHGMEEVVSNRDDDGHEDVEMNTTTLFPRLDLIKLNFMDNLIHVGGGVAAAAAAKGSTSVIYDNDKFSQVAFVSWSLCQYSRHISIWNCSSMVEVFKAREINNNGRSSSSSTNIKQGSIDTTLAIPRPNEITMYNLPNLKTLEILNCDQLEYVFTFSTLESLRQLEQLTIKWCKAMKVIVREEKGGEQTSASKNIMIFPRLKSIKLDDLPNLAGFFLGKNGFEWRLLEYVMISDCPKMKMFTYGESRAPMLKYIHTWLGKHNLECGLNFHLTPTLQQDDDDSYNDDEEDRDEEEETPKKDDIGSCIDNEKDSDEEEETPTKTPSPSLDGSSSCHTILQETPWSFQNLIEMNVAGNKEVTKIIPSNELLDLQKLEKIHVRYCQKVEEVFEVALEVTNSGSNESKTVVKFPKLREVKLVKLDRLKNIWKISRRRILEFPNLTTLSIDECMSLEHVLTCSMVGSLMQLQDLHINNCKNMVVIVKEDEEEECDEKVSEIKFPCLKSLKLEHLPVLKGFCLENENISLPSLNTLVIKDCRELMIFSKGHLAVPELKSAETSLGPININEGEDINSFIITNKQEGLYFGDSYPDYYIY